MSHKNTLLLLSMLIPILALWILLTAVHQTYSAPLLGPQRHVALLGSVNDVDFVAALFLGDGSLQLLREYPNAQSYVAEAPTQYYPVMPPPNLVVRLYELTVDPSQVGVVLAQIQSEANLHNVIMETESLAWLSFVPQQLLVTGECATLDFVMGLSPSVGVPTTIDLDFFDAGICLTNEQVRLYPIVDNNPVLQMVASINEFTSTIVAQPNHFIVGATRDYIAGSPLGPIEPEAPSRTVEAQACTGQDVQVVVFDSSPFPLAVGESMMTSFQGVSVTVRYPHSIPTSLPVGARSVAGHGTFVTNAALDVAPDADFRLVQILNDTAIGDEFTWYQAMNDVISQVIPISNTLAGVVFNYSFSLEVTRTQSLTTTTVMSQVLAAVNNIGVVQVAAVGNDSANRSAPEPMNWPAQHEYVVGATAVTWDEQGLACYANQGQIAIWGGGPARGQSCQIDIVIDCANGTHPEYCVTGWDPDSSTSYSYGMGTSFASPQIAAFAARGISCHGAGPGNWPDPDDIETYIYDQATDNPDPTHIVNGVIEHLYTLPMTTSLYLPFVTSN